MARTTNYDGRRVDIGISQGFNFVSTTEQLTTTALTLDEGGVIVTGIIKLTQNVLVFLLTDEVILDFGWGTLLPRQIQSNAQNMAASIENDFAAAAHETTQALRLNERDDAPDDEKISALILTDWELSSTGDGIILHITVSSVAGETRDVVLPLSTSLIQE